MSNIYDNWERLVKVVLRREELKQLAYISSREPSFSSVSSSISGRSTPEQLSQLAYISSREPSFSSVSSSISGWSTLIYDDQNIQLGSSSSTVNETDWERLLPPDYEDIISRSVIPVAYATKEDLYMSLCSSPILLDGGKMSFHIDKTTGKKCYMIGAKELKLRRNVISTPHADSRFSKVAELRNVWKLDIRGKIETQMLSPKTRYAAFLVCRLEEYCKDLRPAKGIIKFVNLDEDHDAERRATILYLQRGLEGKSKQIAVRRPDGWMEVQLGMFYNDLGSYGPVEARLLKNDENFKIDLVIEGIEFRPANAKTSFVSKENERAEEKGSFQN